MVVKLFLFVLRCDNCNGLFLNWKELPQSLKDGGMEDVVVAHADCCIETDLCDTSDRRTKCINDKTMTGKFLT